MAGRPEKISPIAAEIDDRLTTRGAFADMVRLSERTVDKMITRGQIPIVRFGRNILVDVEGGRAALAARK